MISSKVFGRGSALFDKVLWKLSAVLDQILLFLAMSQH